jgi:hypothetical protein
MRRASVFAALSIAAVGVVSFRGSSYVARAQGTDEKITHSSNGNAENWRIDRPNVKQHLTPYRQITFRPGDRITIQADGCVQTGGTGDTWKRYVNPSGSNTGSYYHGLIQIPGATAGLVRFLQISHPVNGQNKAWEATLVIPQNFATPADLYLRLGYEDDGYGDNGYYSHDNGNNDQCKTGSTTDGGPAFLTIAIQHGAVTQPQPCSGPPYNLDLANSDWDLNGLPLNPRWCSQDAAQQPALPSQSGSGPGECGTPWKAPCTNQAPQIIDLPDWYDLDPYDQLAKTCAASGPLGKHVNWGLVAYEGTARWESWSKPSDISLDPRHLDWPDDDYNINIVRQDQALFTRQNSDNLHTEFDSDETIDNFDTPWWNKFHDAVKNSDSAAGALINNKEIIEIGEAGLDCAHSCGSEIHPVLGMALHVQEDLTDDVWTIFARSAGDEGFCGHVTVFHPELSTMYFKLRWPAGAAPVAPVVTATTKWQKSAVGGGNQIKVTTYPVIPGPQDHAGGFVVRVDLGDANLAPLLNGELHLQWTKSATPLATGVAGRLGALDPARPFRALIAAPAGPTAGPEPEAAFAKMFAALSPAAREKVKQALPVASARPHWTALTATNVRQAPAGSASVAHVGGGLRKGQVKPNDQKKQLYQKAGTALKNSK